LAVPLADRLAGAIEAAVDIFGRLAAYVSVALVLVVAGNVFARYFFRTGTIWLQELEWHLIAPIALIGMSYTLLKGEQVRVDFLYDQMPLALRHVVEIVTGLLTIVFAVIVVKLSLPFVEQAWRIGEGSPNPGGMPYRFALKALIPIGFALLAIQAVANTLRHGLALLRRS
jgi:TRAP-type mannitol/chloroaromatic compound transport system permease small subunit